MNNRSFKRVSVAIGALTLAVAPVMSVAQAATGYAAPKVAPSNELKAERATGNFSAVIARAKGYMGPRFIGKKPKVTLQQTDQTLLNGSPAGLPSPSALTKFYPDDMGYYGGPVVQSANQVNIYWANDNGSIWGNPATYESNVNLSLMSEVLDQYTFQPQSNGHWPVSGYYWYFPSGGPGSLIYDSQVAAEVQAIATYDRTNFGQPLGTGTMYHVFLPPGTDECFDNPANGCYNPDGLAPGPFAFCAYHSYTTLGDGTVVLYTVEPYMNVGGCSTGDGLANDTANVLGHEFAELVSDPEPGSAWVGRWPDSYGSEIGDDCAWTIIKQSLNSVIYYTQDWYSNRYHNCNRTY